MVRCYVFCRYFNASPVGTHWPNHSSEAAKSIASVCWSYKLSLYSTGPLWFFENTTTPNNAAPKRCHYIASVGRFASTIILFEAAKSIICIGRRHLSTKISTCRQLFNFNGYTHLISLQWRAKSQLHDELPALILDVDICEAVIECSPYVLS
jgi:hypothetical protein